MTKIGDQSEALRNNIVACSTDCTSIRFDTISLDISSFLGS